MEEHEQIKNVLGTALMFTIITSVFSLLNKLSTLILTNGGLKKGVNIFIENNILWIIVAAAIILLLIIYIKKLNQVSYLDILQNENIHLSTGVLVALQGLINLSSLLPIYIMSIQTSLKIPYFAGKSIEEMGRKTIIVDVISAAIIFCQILFGIYLAKYYKKKIN